MFLNSSKLQNRQFCMETFSHGSVLGQFSLCEPHEQICSILGYPVDFGLQTWNVKSTMPEANVQV